jgi:carboxyl-terminal processing protease
MENQTSFESKRKWIFIALQIVIVILAIAVGYFGHRILIQYQGEFGLVRQARDIVLENTILAIPEEPGLEYGMIRGMLETLNDPHTIFVEPAAHEVQSDQLTGSYGGIGIRLERDTQMQWRIYPLPNSPALEAGIQDADLLLQVGGLVITSETDDVALLAAIRGPVGEKVNLTVQRKGETLTFTIERQSVPLPSVTWNLLPEAPDIGLVQVNRIADTTADEIQAGIEDLQAQGAKALILDLRDNGGGLVEAGVDIARLFLADGEIIHQQFKNEEVKVFEVEEPGPYSEIPLVVLVNGNTASSAEIVTGALKAHQRAVLIGTPTYGKTTIQYVFDLEDGSSVHVTSGHWWIPGISFPLTPDRTISEDPTGTIILQTAIEVFQNANQ